MTSEEIIRLVIELFVFCGALISTTWKINAAITKKIEETDRSADCKIKRVYERIDERSKGYYNDFVLAKVHASDLEHFKEMSDQKFLHMIELFNTQLGNLTGSINELKKCHQKNEGNQPK
jgi:hypothetical protein